MVSTLKKEVSMPPNSAHVDGLAELFELNRLFLISLRSDLRNGDNSYALPAAAIRLVRRATSQTLEGLAGFPQALFDLDLGELQGLGVDDQSAPRLEPVARALNLTILISAWNMSRQSGYAARLFLRLSAGDIRALRTTPLSELPRLSMQDRLVVCAFREPEWLWAELLTEVRPEQRRRLLLLGLQPHSEINRRVRMHLRASI